MDNVKCVNDTIWSSCGRCRAATLSAITLRALRPGNMAGRWGSEEFLVLLPDTAAAEALELADKLRRSLGGHDFADGLRCAVSIGVAVMRREEHR